jgi:3-hydroxybutyryl-CoA dehydrogenase
MNILVIGTDADFALIREKFGEVHTYAFVEDASLALNDFEEQDIVFDFLIEEYPDNMDAYKEVEGLPVFLNIPKLSLAELYYYNEHFDCLLYGFNGLPGFFENEKWEVSILFEKDKPKLEEIFTSLGVAYHLVQDRVGMVSPRVVCMIINEAFYTVMEGTATVKDIDQAMKLGTNYPYGPFEWLERIGVNNVYELLEAVYDDTKDERYKICPMLKRRYLMGGG